MVSTTVKYPIQCMLPRPYTLECTLEMVSDIACIFLFVHSIGSKTGRAVGAVTSTNYKAWGHSHDSDTASPFLL